VRVLLPIRTVSLANAHEHWRVRQRRAKAERLQTRIALIVMGAEIGRDAVPQPPCQVALTRIAPRDLDSDNLSPSCKSIRDEIAAFLGIDDRDPRVTWVYDQRRGKAREYSVEVEIKAARPQEGR
jgi:hypothetical protein